MCRLRTGWRTNNPTSRIDFTNPRLGRESNPQPYTRCPDDPFHGVLVITISLTLLIFFLSVDSALISDYVPDSESRQALSEYLCSLTLKDQNGFEICLPERGTPQGFHLIHNRRSERSRYEICPGFTVTFSKESTWPSDLSMEEPRELV